MAQKDKQLSTEHYTENKRLSDTNSIKHRGQIKCYGSVSSSWSNYDAWIWMAVWLKVNIAKLESFQELYFLVNNYQH